MWSVTIKEQHKLRVFENRFLRRIFGRKRPEATGEWRKLHSEELHNLYSSPNIIRQVKSRRMRLLGHLSRMGEKRNVYKVLVGKPEGKTPLGVPRHSWEEWIRLAQDGDLWQALVDTAMNLRVLAPRSFLVR
jgi:hypothetical protein